MQVMGISMHLHCNRCPPLGAPFEALNLASVLRRIVKLVIVLLWRSAFDRQPTRPQEGTHWRSQGLKTRSGHRQPALWLGLAASPRERYTLVNFRTNKLTKRKRTLAIFLHVLLISIHAFSHSTLFHKAMYGQMPSKAASW